jgi:hypothetical protein
MLRLLLRFVSSCILHAAAAAAAAAARPFGTTAELK